MQRAEVSSMHCFLLHEQPAEGGQPHRRPVTQHALVCARLAVLCYPALSYIQSCQDIATPSVHQDARACPGLQVHNLMSLGSWIMLSGKLCFSTAFTAFGISTSVPMSIPLQRWLIWVPGTYGSMCFALFGAFQVNFWPSLDHGLCALCT